MKVLFIVQGEGRGHLTQAITMEELLRRNGHEVVEVLVGKSNSRCLPGFFNRSIQAPVKRFLSPNFLPTPANKRASLARSVAYNLTRLPVYLKSMHYIHRRIEESGAELVINFYELLTGMTNFVEAMITTLYSGQSVNIKNFGVFSLSARTAGVLDVKECTAKNIKAVKINFRPSSTVRPDIAATRAGQKIDFYDLEALLNKGDGEGGSSGGGSGSGDGGGSDGDQGENPLG